MNVPKAKHGIAELKRKATELAASLGGKYSVVLSLPPAPSDRLGWLDGGTARQPARPVFDLGSRESATRAAMVRVITTRMKQDVASTGRVNVLVALTLGAQELRAVHVDRLSTSGADVSWDPLSPGYAARKRRLGLDSRTGVATGATLAAVKAAQIVIRKV